MKFCKVTNYEDMLLIDLKKFGGIDNRLYHIPKAS